MPRPKPKKKSPAAKAVGRVVQARRNSARLTQERFAELADLSKNYIGNIERGEYEVSITALDRIARIVKLRASDLLREAGY